MKDATMALEVIQAKNPSLSGMLSYLPFGVISTVGRCT
jgi:hypothetical protein